ncbi:hypothetical protein KSS90_17220 [Pseudomonas maumuensis]|uniref:Dermonecrotic toxin N-terminal domain-containing protein n=1 Tax=Pseudomonas maumuensis TaxID=2842354 RepID=A0ABX8NHQ6_9PSED|nr:hypothetical protein KSS90_17220 [Pseudomonas maumuensis]
MSSNTSPVPVPASSATITDDFIGRRLPGWLARASAGQINRLRDRFTAYRSSQEPVKAMLEPLDLLQFAQAQFATLLAGRLPQGVELAGLRWQTAQLDVGRSMGSNWSYIDTQYRHEPALWRLMQNFGEGATPLDGSGLVAADGETVLSGDVATLAQACRVLDAGGRYQQLLRDTFTADNKALLATDKRAGFGLAIEVAALRSEITAHQQQALNGLLADESATSRMTAHPQLLTLLGQSVAGALAIQLRDEQQADNGWILYLPGDPAQALSRFESLSAMNDTLAERLGSSAFERFFVQLIELGQRTQFVQTLALRLKDDRPDLQVAPDEPDGPLFDALVEQQLRRLQQDARLLLVPSAEADLRASRARLEAWTSAGWALVNLAGFFIPVVGMVLLGQLLLQTLHEVYEGVVDWAQGHQHEALEHMLGVAETLAVSAAVAGGASMVARGFLRSGFVEGLEPVSVGERGERLWANDLQAYEVSPEDAALGEDGLYHQGERRWLRLEARYYRIHRPEADGPWRLLHPRREEGFGPIVDGNGERGWHLRSDQARTWNDSGRMLDSVWPQHPALDSQRADSILRVAGMDKDELRAVIGENRPLPANLRDTLRRFAADARIDAFFGNLEHPEGEMQDRQIQEWCLEQSGMSGLDAAALRERLLAQAPLLRERLMEYLTRVTLGEDTLLALIKRDFPTLPDAYVLELAQTVNEGERLLVAREARVPATVAGRVRALLQVARLNRALEGVFLRNSYSQETGKLVFSLLSQIPGWPVSLCLELRANSATGLLLARSGTPAQSGAAAVLVRREGRFHLYDNRGRVLQVDVDEPAGLFQTLVALLNPERLNGLGIVGENQGEQLRQLLLAQLPQSRVSLLRLLGWRQAAPWFNPGRRLADGRVGYPLSGRGQGQRNSWDVLRDRIRALYWGFTETQVEDYLHILLCSSASPFEVMLAQERNYAQLEQTLARWESSQAQASRRALRQRLAASLRGAWRLQGEVVNDTAGQPEGMRLDLSGIRVQDLPELPEEVDFSHVTVLSMANMDLTQVPVGFLRRFGSLTRLNLGSNRLHRMPEALPYLLELRELRLAHNRLRLDQAGITALASLPELRHLDLSYNPLSTLTLRFNQLSRLATLRLRHCRLHDWPGGLDLCGLLEYVDLRDNNIASLPLDIQRMPLRFRMSFVVDRNPLPVADLSTLYSVEQHVAHNATVTSSTEQVLSRDAWLNTLAAADRAARGQQWNVVSAMAESHGLFQLLEELRRTADFQGARLSVRTGLEFAREFASGWRARRQCRFARAHLRPGQPATNLRRQCRRAFQRYSGAAVGKHRQPSGRRRNAQGRSSEAGASSVPSGSSGTFRSPGHAWSLRTGARGRRDRGQSFLPHPPGAGVRLAIPAAEHALWRCCPCRARRVGGCKSRRACSRDTSGACR